MADERFDLADVIVNLRQTLKRAEDKGAEEDLKFLVGEIEVELKIAVTEEEGGKVGVKFWVLNAEASGKAADQAVQTIRLTLTPEQGGEPLRISRSRRRREGREQ